MEDIYGQLDLPKIATSTKRKESEFIYNFLKDNNIKKTLEVGFAYGCSAAHIISATNNTHYVMDPFQNADFSNCGLKNIKKLGLEKFLKFEEDYSRIVLPKLEKEGIKVDFAFVDGDHKYDDIFIDFCLIDPILNQKGFILFHDSWMRSTQYVASWIRNNRKDYKEIKNPIKNLILFQKDGEDNRNWHHFKGFFTLKSLAPHTYFNLRQKLKN